MLSRNLLVVLAAAGCADETVNPGPMPDPNDETPPTVVSTVPAAGATGIAAGQKIVVTFSEAMDRATVEAAYASASLPLDKLSMSWSEDMTTLTISPDQPLIYAEGIGNDPSTVAALVYALSIGGADLAGNAMEAPVALSFATKRRLVTALGYDDYLTRTRSGISFLATSTDMWIGDNDLDSTYLSYITFDLSPLPQGIAIESAQFSARQLNPTGAPYNMGAVMTDHVTFGVLSGAYQAPALSTPGALSMDGNAESKVLDVTSQVADDIANRVARSDHSQYRLQIQTATNENGEVDKATFAKNTFEMTAVYIAD